VLRRYLTASRAKSPTEVEDPVQPRRGLLSLRSTVILAIATAAGLVTGHWSEPQFGVGAWVALVIGLDGIIDDAR
jgi:hypothetical protein